MCSLGVYFGKNLSTYSICAGGTKLSRTGTNFYSFWNNPPIPQLMFQLSLNFFLLACFFSWLHTLWKLQNYRTGRVGRDIWRWPSPNLLPRQGQVEQLTQESIPVGFECLQRGKFHKSPGQPVQCSATLKVKEFFFTLRWNSLCFCLRPLLLVVLLGTEVPGTTLLAPTTEISICIDEISSQSSLL